MWMPAARRAGRRRLRQFHLHRVDEVFQHRLDEHSTRTAASQLGRADPDEIVEMRADNRQELDPIEEGNRVVLCFIEHAPLKPKEAQLTVVEQQRVARVFGRYGTLDERCIRFARVGAERCAIWCSSSGRRMTRQTNRRKSVRSHSSRQRQRWQTTYHTSGQP